MQFLVRSTRGHLGKVYAGGKILESDTDVRATVLDDLSRSNHARSA